MIRLPADCKPSKCLALHDRPDLEHAYIVERDDGFWLCACDTYVAVAVLLEVSEVATLHEGWVPASILRFVEQGWSHNVEQVDKCTWTFRDAEHVEQSHAVPPLGDYPSLAALGLWDEPKKDSGTGQAFGLNPRLFARLGKALGSRAGVRVAVERPRGAIQVRPLVEGQGTVRPDAVGLIMPVKLMGEGHGE